MKVTNTVRVNFTIGNYTDIVECDVVPMTVCHLLLGRPWQYDRDVRHNGKANTHQLRWQGKDIVLRPMTPQDIVNESRQKTEVRLEQDQQRREPALAVHDPFSASAAAHFSACFVAATELVGRTVPPLHGDADGLATATTAMTAAPPTLGDADGSAHAATARTDTGEYILMATKEDLLEFGDDPTAIPLVLVYKRVRF